ncbi:MAG: SH3 domain-containing protein [Anaerolineae bacterium]|nr:SH3 domain-containing protein [Anaerolineae bacterium]
MKNYFVAVLCIILGFSVTPTLAQDTGQTGVKIQWPPPVTEVWGSGDVIGTAAVPGMAYYYLEYLPLNDDLSFPDSAPWIPTTIAIDQTVVDGVLATLDTTQVSDGLYALRLVVNTFDNQSYMDTVSPIRVNNGRFSRVTEGIIRQALIDAGVIPPEEPTAEPTLVPTSPPVDMTPRVVPAGGVSAANVRNCDVIDNYSCAIVGYLNQGESAVILGVSSNYSGWYQIVLPSGLTGWISPSVIVTSGDLSNLPLVTPPAPLPPPAAPNVILNGIAIEGGIAVCAQPFNAQINIANVGNAASEAGSVSLQDVNIRTGEITFTNYGSFPSISPGGNFVVVIPVTSSAYYNEDHELRAYTGNQQMVLRYTLQQGNCGFQPTQPPPPPPTQPPPPPPTPVNPGRDFGPNQCFLVLTNPKVVFDVPYGNPQGTLDPAPYNAVRVEQINGSLWYRVGVPLGIGQAWMDGTGIDKQGNCSLEG